MSEITLNDVMSELRVLGGRIDGLDGRITGQSLTIGRMDARLGVVETRLGSIDAHLEMLTLAMADLARMIRAHRHDPDTGQPTFRDFRDVA